MDRNVEWDEFLNGMLACALKNLQATREYEYRKQRREQIDEMLTTNLTWDEKELVDEILFEIGAAAEHESGMLYRQGVKDCVWLLKSLGVLA